MQIVPAKSEEQLVLYSLHRAREPHAGEQRMTAGYVEQCFSYLALPVSVPSQPLAVPASVSQGAAVLIESNDLVRRFLFRQLLRRSPSPD
jgi:hypothetical protein